MESGNSKWISKGWGKKKKSPLEFVLLFSALPRMVGAAGLGNVEMSQKKEGNILFIPKLGGFRSSFLWHQTQIHLFLSLLSLSSCCFISGQIEGMNFNLLGG